jgi:hypothetical protein
MIKIAAFERSRVNAKSIPSVKRSFDGRDAFLKNV